MGTDAEGIQFKKSSNRKWIYILVALFLVAIVALAIALAVVTTRDNQLESEHESEEKEEEEEDDHTVPVSCIDHPSNPNCAVPGGSKGDGFEPTNVRSFYLTAEKELWDYLPQQKNLANDFDVYLNDTLINGPNRIGSRYNKYVYKQYTDSTYTQEVPKDPYMGYQGPLIRGEVGEVILIHFLNRVDMPVTVHPHGVRYTKINEGANYQDGTGPAEKVDDAVPPGKNITLLWQLGAELSLTDEEPNCVPFAYHSHLEPEMEVNTGLVGILLVCKPGILNKNGVRADVDKEFVLYFDSIDEGASLVFQENLNLCQDPAECRRLYDAGDPDFMESLKKDTINGFMYGNMPDAQVCAGHKVAWYLYSLNAELHTVNIHGQTFEQRHHRNSVVGIYSATFREVEMTAINPGRWLIQCLNSEHNRNGMENFLTVVDCHDYKGVSGSSSYNDNTRRYYFKTEKEIWDYAPTGVNSYDGVNLTTPGSESEMFFAKTYNGKQQIGGQYIKARYHQYTNDSFLEKVPQDQHLGLLGPVIRAEVGDTVLVTLHNGVAFPVSIYLQGVSVEKTQDGTWIRQGAARQMSGNLVLPGNVGTYKFTVPWELSPGENDPQCLTYMYYSARDFERDVNSGLVGPLLICKQGSLDAISGRQKFVDKEMFLFFASIDENFSWYINTNVETYTDGTVDTADADFVESNFMRSINGRSYGNLEGLNICKNDQVVWHVFSFGQTEGLHSVTFNGNNVMINGVHRDSHVTVSGETFEAMMRPDNVGKWALSCSNSYHFDGGMKATYNVQTCDNKRDPYFRSSGVTRRYYIAAVERKWNYSPETIHPLTGANYSDPSSDQYSRIQKDGKFIGSVYKKAMYREFTDETFTVEKPITPDTVHLGILGPFIRAEIGDIVEVVFKNMASREYSIHAQGLWYNKTYEGMNYADGTGTPKGVAPGATFTYRWKVPATSGPAMNNPNCMASMYHSGVNPTKDMYSGLAGPIVICRPGMLNADNTRGDYVEKEFALLFLAFDENASWYIDENIQENCPNADTTTDAFVETNMYDSINALIYNNVKGLIAHKGDNIAWYVLGMGANEDMHTAHFHGQTFTYHAGAMREGDVVEVFPGTYETIEMYANNPGTWLIHCHVGQHVSDGMVGTYTILEN